MNTNQWIGTIGFICSFISLVLALIQFLKDHKRNKTLNKVMLGFIYISVICILLIFGRSSISIHILQNHPIQFDPRIFMILITAITIHLFREKYKALQNKFKELDENCIKSSPYEKTDSLKTGPFLKIEVKKLKQYDSARKVRLSWETFGECIDNLKAKVCECGGAYPDIIFGINEAGIIVASYLSYFCEGRPPIGAIKTSATYKDENEKSRRQIKQFDFPNGKVPQSPASLNLQEEERIDIKDAYLEYPDIQNPKKIAIVDSEIKTGSTAEYIIDMLKNKYGNIDIIYIGLGGVIKADNKGISVDNIEYFGWDIKNKGNKPNFIEFFVDWPGFEPPGGIR